jgi:hypothetical protein
MSLDVSGFKDGRRRMWTAGDYPEIARTIATPAELATLLALPRSDGAATTSSPA